MHQDVRSRLRIISKHIKTKYRNTEHSHSKLKHTETDQYDLFTTLKIVPDKLCHICVIMHFLSTFGQSRVIKPFSYV